MTREEMHDFMLSLPHTICDFKEEWGTFLYKIDNKFYAMMAAEKNEKPIISMKCNPARAEELRIQYPDQIRPGYYLNKAHWNSIDIDNKLDNALIKELLTHAHELIFNGLSKKRRNELADLLRAK